MRSNRTGTSANSPFVARRLSIRASATRDTGTPSRTRRVRARTATSRTAAASPPRAQQNRGTLFRIRLTTKAVSVPPNHALSTNPDSRERACRAADRAGRAGRADVSPVVTMAVIVHGARDSGKTNGTTLPDGAVPASG